MFMTNVDNHLQFQGPGSLVDGVQHYLHVIETRSSCCGSHLFWWISEDSMEPSNYIILIRRELQISSLKQKWVMKKKGFTMLAYTIFLMRFARAVGNECSFFVRRSFSLTLQENLVRGEG